MSDFLEEIEHIVDATIPDKDELIHEGHRDRDYAMLITRNLLVGVAYFCGAGAYVFECLLLTDCFKTKVPHKEMFMVYCLGPLYLIMGLGYILK